jgi:MFS family permease
MILLPMTVASVVTASTGGMLTAKISYRNVMLISGVIFLIGTYLLSTITPETTKLTLTLFMILAGLGVGFSFSVLAAAAVHGMDFRQRGQATSTSSFLRTLGMTLGISVFGIIQRNLLSDKLAETFAGQGGGPQFSGDARALLSPEARAHIPAPVLDKITDALSSSIATTFLWTVLAAGTAFVFIVLMSNERLLAMKKDNG